MKSKLSLLLLTSLLFLSGCNEARGVPDDMAWLEPCEFQESTKAWLLGLEWPPSAYVDFDKIAKMNDIIRKLKAVPK